MNLPKADPPGLFSLEALEKTRVRPVIAPPQMSIVLGYHGPSGSWSVREVFHGPAHVRCAERFVEENRRATRSATLEWRIYSLGPVDGG